ncbi:hypothetical protein FA95DRAFT_1609156 [Auriscalpium vulgare]|uniref:Uncharacterized protein n=1 Tax=Auriscalpium vulgare TaxID=40419 RepID=A0ACB8RIE6_9AGAM|nr:hypothetical protein FA95DRAFT_1609156 [Auriscalpium vulgare]
MQSKAINQRRTLLYIALIILKSLSIWWMRRRLYPAHTEADLDFALGDDTPRRWDIGELDSVIMPSEETVHYEVYGSTSNAEWHSLFPDHGTLHLGPQRRPYSISMFHQLRCLGIYRHELVRTHSPNATYIAKGEELTRHCLNYLRQMALCRLDTTLLPLVGHPKPHPAPDMHVCKDWEKVYAEVEKNQREYARSLL